MTSAKYDLCDLNSLSFCVVSSNNQNNKPLWTNTLSPSSSFTVQLSCELPSQLWIRPVAIDMVSESSRVSCPHC